MPSDEQVKRYVEAEMEKINWPKPEGEPQQGGDLREQISRIVELHVCADEHELVDALEALVREQVEAARVEYALEHTGRVIAEIDATLAALGVDRPR
jgi:hypothetical protein